MGGLFINTVPALARLAGPGTFAELLRRVQSAQSELFEHQHLGLTEIQREAGVGELFDTLLVFENYPLDPEAMELPSTGLRLTDIGPMRAARREELLALGLRDRRFGWPLEMVLRAYAAGWRIEETQAPYRPRHAGKSKVTGTMRGFVRTVRDMTAVMG